MIYVSKELSEMSVSPNPHKSSDRKRDSISRDDGYLLYHDI